MYFTSDLDQFSFLMNQLWSLTRKFCPPLLRVHSSMYKKNKMMFSHSGWWRLSTVVEALGLSPDAPFPSGTQSPKQPGRPIYWHESRLLSFYVLKKIFFLSGPLCVSVEPAVESGPGSGVSPPSQHSGAHHNALGPRFPADARSGTASLRKVGFTPFAQSSSFCSVSSSPGAAPDGFSLRVGSIPSSASLLPLHSDILATVFTPEGQPYLLEVI